MATSKAQRAARQAAKARMAAEVARVREVVLRGTCPCCGSALRQNSAMAGWWQCEQYGSDDHRARPQDPQCGWQGFTE